MRFIKEEIDDKIDCAYVYFITEKAYKTVFKRRGVFAGDTTIFFYPIAIVLDKGKEKIKLPIEKFYEKFGEKASMKYSVNDKRKFDTNQLVITLKIDGKESSFNDKKGRTILYYDAATIVRREQKAFTEKLFMMYIDTAPAFEFGVDKEEEKRFLDLL